MFDRRDYRDCFAAMSSAMHPVRLRLERKYGVPLKNLYDLFALAQRLLEEASPAEREAEERAAERALMRISASLIGRKGGSVKSKRKAKASRENGKRGGRPPKSEAS